MFLALLLSISALGQTCPDLGEQTRLAWDRYGQAELEAAAAALERAESAVVCQTGPLSRAALLELHWLRALVALSSDDAPEVRRALAAAVAVDHTERPPIAYGPELRSLWEQLAARASTGLVSIVVQGAGPAWIDGREVGPGAAVQVAPGPHVVQVQEGLQWSTEVRQIDMSHTVSTGGVPTPTPTAPPLVRRRQRPPVLWIATAAVGAASAFAIGSGIRSERSFASSRYRAISYDHCRYDQPCYPVVRENAIRADASRINVAYGVGYGLAVLSGGLLTVTIVGLPEGRRDP